MATVRIRNFSSSHTTLNDFFLRTSGTFHKHFVSGIYPNAQEYLLQRTFIHVHKIKFPGGFIKSTQGDQVLFNPFWKINDDEILIFKEKPGFTSDITAESFQVVLCPDGVMIYAEPNFIELEGMLNQLLENDLVYLWYPLFTSESHKITSYTSANSRPVTSKDIVSKAKGFSLYKIVTMVAKDVLVECFLLEDELVDKIPLFVTSAAASCVTSVSDPLDGVWQKDPISSYYSLCCANFKKIPHGILMGLQNHLNNDFFSRSLLKSGVSEVDGHSIKDSDPVLQDLFRIHCPGCDNVLFAEILPFEIDKCSDAWFFHAPVKDACNWSDLMLKSDHQDLGKETKERYMICQCNTYVGFTPVDMPIIIPSLLLERNFKMKEKKLSDRQMSIHQTIVSHGEAMSQVHLNSVIEGKLCSYSYKAVPFNASFMTSFYFLMQLFPSNLTKANLELLSEVISVYQKNLKPKKIKDMFLTPDLFVKWIQKIKEKLISQPDSASMLKLDAVAEIDKCLVWGRNLEKTERFGGVLREAKAGVLGPRDNIEDPAESALGIPKGKGKEKNHNHYSVI